MPLEHGIWRIDGDLNEVAALSLNMEERLETIFAKDISIVWPRSND